jgi:hypothetical protein
MREEENALAEEVQPETLSHVPIVLSSFIGMPRPIRMPSGVVWGWAWHAANHPRFTANFQLG